MRIHIVHLNMAPYSLESDPFPMDGTDGCFVPTAQLSHHLHLLHQLVQYGEKRVEIVAPSGAGKTTLIEHLLADAADQWHACRIVGNPLLTRDALLIELSSALKLPQRRELARDALLIRLDAHFEALQRTRQIALIAIDDVDCLSDDMHAYTDELAQRWQTYRVRFLSAREPRQGERLDDDRMSNGSLEAVDVIDLRPRGYPLRAIFPVIMRREQER